MVLVIAQGKEASVSCDVRGGFGAFGAVDLGSRRLGLGCGRQVGVCGRIYVAYRGVWGVPFGVVAGFLASRCGTPLSVVCSGEAEECRARIGVSCFGLCSCTGTWMEGTRLRTFCGEFGFLMIGLCLRTENVC